MRAGEGRESDMANGLSDRELLAAFRDGDDQIYNELWRRHHPAALRAAWQYERNGPPEEIAAEAFARVLEAARHGSGPAEAFRSYLLRTVYDVVQAANRVRQHSALFDDAEQGDAVPGDAGSTDPATATLSQHYINQSYERLTAPQREVLWYVEVERTSAADAAVFMGLSTDAAGAVASGAREALGRQYVQIHLENLGDRPECHAVLSKLERYVHGSLVAPHRARVDRHLEECASCTLALADLRDLGGCMRSVLGPIVLGPAAAGYFLVAAEELALADVVPVSGAYAEGAAGGGRSFVRVTGAAAATVLVIGGLAAGAVMVTGGGEMTPTETSHREAALGKQQPPGADDEPTPSATAESRRNPGDRNTPTAGSRTTPPTTKPATPTSTTGPASKAPTSGTARPTRRATTGPSTPEPGPSESDTPAPPPAPTPEPEPTTESPAPPTTEPSPSPSPRPTTSPLSVTSHQLTGPVWEGEGGPAYVLAVTDGAEPGTTITLRISGPLLSHTSEPAGTLPSGPPLVDDGAWECASSGLLTQGYECTSTADEDGQVIAAMETERTLGALQQGHELQLEVTADGEQDETTVTVE